MDSGVKDIISRLESIVCRLEKVEGQLGKPAASANADADDESPILIKFEEIVEKHLPNFKKLSDEFAGNLAEQAKDFMACVDAQKKLIEIAIKSKKPADKVFAELLKPQSELMGKIAAYKDKCFRDPLINNISGIAEGVAVLGWIGMPSGKPWMFMNDVIPGCEFYTNRVLTAFKGKDQKQVSWVQSFVGFLKDLSTYVKECHNLGLTWNPKGEEAKPVTAAKAAGGPPAPPPPPPADIFDAKPAAPAAKPAAAALFAELNQGASVTSGLKKVTRDMTNKDKKISGAVSAPAKKAPVKKAFAAAPAKKKPPRFELDGNKWFVEFQDGNRDLVIDDTDQRQVVYIYGCNQSTIQVKGKVNVIGIDNCKKTAVVCDNVISVVELVNSQSIEVQVTGITPSISVDKCSGARLYLSEEATKENCTQIVSSKSSEMNVILPAKDERSDPIEQAIPEQFITKFEGKKIVTVSASHV